MTKVAASKEIVFVLFDLILYVPISNLSVTYVRTCLPGLNQYQARINVSCSRTQHDDDEALTRGPSVSSQALYH